MSDWKKIWSERKSESQILLSGDAKSVLLELKRINGFDVDGELTFNAFSEQYEEFKNHLQKYRQIQSVYEIGCGSGANLYMFEQEDYKCGGIDYSVGLTSVARKVLKTTDILCAEAEAVPTDICYDAVFSNGVFSYFDSIEYAERVLEKMYEKARYSIGVMDIPDINTKEEFIAYRRQIDKNYDIRYKNLPKLFYSKDFFIGFAQRHHMEIEFLELHLEGYWNNLFDFTCYMYKV